MVRSTASRDGSSCTQRVALHQLLNDEGLALVGLSGVEHADDVRVIEARRGARFAHEALHQIGAIATLRAKQLQRDWTIEPRIVRAIHLAHPATAEQVFESVMCDESVR